MSGDPRSIAEVLRERAARSDLWIPTSGSSMGRDVPPGTMVLVRPETRSPRLGEVWAFVTAAGDVTVHRYLRRTSLGRFVFVGDRAESADAPIRAEWLVGRVPVVEEGGRRRRLRRVSAVRPLVLAAVRGVRRRLSTRRAGNR